MKKKVLVAVVATMVCAALAVGCGKSKTGSGNMVNNENATEITETVSFETESDATIEETYIPVSERVADRFGVKLESNQGIISGTDDVAVTMTIPDGYKFTTQYADNSVSMLNDEYSESYEIFVCNDTFTEEYMNKYYDVEDYGNGCFIQADKQDKIINAFWFGDGVKIAFLYTNGTGNPTNFDAVSANIMSIIESFNICK